MHLGPGDDFPRKGKVLPRECGRSSVESQSCPVSSNFCEFCFVHNMSFRTGLWLLSYNRVSVGGCSVLSDL